MSQKLFFTDLDFTLLNSKKEITPRNMDAINRVKAAGHSVIIATGRPLCSALQQAERLGLTGPNSYCITFNGALLYDISNQKELHKMSLPLSFVRELFDCAYEFGYHVQTYSIDSVYSEKDTYEVQTYSRLTHVPYKVFPDVCAALDSEPCKVLVAHYTDHAGLVELQKEMIKRFSDRADIIFSSDTYLEIIPKGVSKGSALRALASYLNVPIEHTVAAGDAENDLPLIAEAGIGCCMCNGEEQVKAIADYVTENDCDHDGVAEILERFILNEK